MTEDQMEDEKKKRTKLVLDTLIKNFTQVSRIKGVTRAGAGFKKKSGVYTDEICIFIEVEKKTSLNELEKEEVIPASIDNITTDVVEQKPATLFDLVITEAEADNENKYRPLVGGCQITNGIAVNGYISVGTLGCFVHLPDKKNPFNALLSNKHVMFANGGDKGGAIYQPSKADGKVGTIYEGKSLGPEVDFAIAKQESGVGVQNKVLEVGDLVGFGDAVVGMRVRKYGRTTELTTGQVTKVGIWVSPDPPYTVVYTGLEIEQGYPKIGSATRFSDHGDSGSVIVDNAQKVIGLLWGGYDSVPYTSFANDQRRLHQVEGAFTLPVPTTYQMQQIFSDTERINKYKELLQQTEHGRTILNAFVSNVAEGFRLNNYQRECMVAWQRNKGPAFMSLRKDLDKDVPYKFERSIGGVTVEEMFVNMAEAYKKYGNESIRKVLEEHGDEILSYIRQSESMEDIIALIIKK